MLFEPLTLRNKANFSEIITLSEFHRHFSTFNAYLWTQVDAAAYHAFIGRSLLSRALLLTFMTLLQYEVK